MRGFTSGLLAVLFGLLTGLSAAGQARRIESLNAGWKFALGAQPGAESVGFDDSRWRAPSVPHDWSIKGPFRADSPAGQGGAFLPTGIGWYRKKFQLSPNDKGQRIFVEIDGVMANSEVRINGFSLGTRPNGAVDLRYELTEHVKFGVCAVNLLAVRADNSAQPASRWYAGAGIYRAVRLIVTSPVHLEADSIFVSSPAATAAHAAVIVQSAVINQSARARLISARITIKGPSGRQIQSVETPFQSVPAGKSVPFNQEVSLVKPTLWSLEHPELWSAIVTVQEGPGALRAIGKNASKEVVNCTLRTAGKPARLELTADSLRLSTDPGEVASILVTVTDANGVIVPDSTPLIGFNLVGHGEIISVDNGDLLSHESFQAHERHAFQGHCLAVLRASASSGVLTLNATTPGLAPATLTLRLNDKLLPKR